MAESAGWIQPKDSVVDARLMVSAPRIRVAAQVGKALSTGTEMIGW